MELPQLAIPMGAYPGVSSINKFGENATVASGATETVWAGSTLYSFPATALITSMSQTADQEAMRGATIEVQGLDANFAEVTQTALLNATLTTNVVTLATPLRRVFRARVLANVVGDSPIRIHNAGETVDYAVIGTGNNQTTMAVYCVPAGKTAYLIGYYGFEHPVTGQAPTSLNFKLYGQDNANVYAKQLKHTVGLPVGGHFDHHFDVYVPFTEKTDIYIDVTTVGGAAHVTSGFDLILVDNTHF